MKKFTFILLLALGSSFLTPVKAQFIDIYNFTTITGAEPFGSLILSNGKLFGTCFLGGAHDSGSIFSVDTNGLNYKDLYDFSGPDGKEPNSPLTLVGGLIYGTANAGGAHDSGCMFSLDTTGGGFRDLYDFSGPDGKNPYNTLLLSGGVLFGMADGGAHNIGCIFKIDTDGTGYKKLFDFTTPLTQGEDPLGITLVGTKLFGMTLIGGTNSYGIIYSIDTTGLNFKDLFNFTYASGIEPFGCLTYSNGQLFGATDYGGTLGYGTLFSIDTTGHNGKKLYDFSGFDGAQPEYAGGSLSLFGTTLFGTTYYGGAYDSGCVFRIDTAGQGFALMYDFTGTKGALPEGSIILNGSELYGSCFAGGTNHLGTIFSYDTGTITTSTHQLSMVNGQLSVYPNPSNGVFNFGIKNEKGRMKNIEIYNELGEKVYSQLSTLNSQFSINLSNQPNGVYFYRVSDNTGSLIGEGKLTIQK